MESFSKHDIQFDWMFQMRSWHIKRVFLNGASLHDHEKVNLFNLTSQAAPGRLSRPSQPGIFMKVLSEQLFHESSPFTKENTLLIDDSREKSVCNESGNAIFLKPWTHEDQNDNVLLGQLLPWLESLHNG